jgi:nitroreductase
LIQEAAFGQAQVTAAPHLFVITAVANVDEEYIKKYIQHISEVRGVTLESLEGFQSSMIGDIARRSVEQKLAWAGRQAYIALGAMIETAALLGVDAGPMEGFIPVKVNEILKLEEKGLHALGLLALGYRENDAYSEMKKVRLPKDELIITL